MSTEPQLTPSPAVEGATTRRHELEALRDQWWWFLVLGIAMIVLGTVAIGSSFFVSVVTIMLWSVVYGLWQGAIRT